MHWHLRQNRTDMTNEVLNILEKRRSIRAYRPEQIKDEELEAILRAGTFAPTSRGMQSPFIVAVQNKDMADELRKMNAYIMGTESDPYYGAPTIILVFVPEDFANGIYDATCVLENMMIAATSLNIGTCWIHRETEMFASDEGKLLMQKMGLPKGLKGIGALAVGYAAAEPAPAKERKEGYARIIR